MITWWSKQVTSLDEQLLERPIDGMIAEAIADPIAEVIAEAIAEAAEDAIAARIADAIRPPSPMPFDPDASDTTVIADASYAAAAATDAAASITSAAEEMLAEIGPLGWLARLENQQRDGEEPQQGEFARMLAEIQQRDEEKLQ